MIQIKISIKRNYVKYVILCAYKLKVFERFNLPKTWPNFRRVKRNKKLWPSKFFQKKPKTKTKRLPKSDALLVKRLDIMQKIVLTKAPRQVRLMLEIPQIEDWQMVECDFVDFNLLTYCMIMGCDLNWIILNMVLCMSIK